MNPGNPGMNFSPALGRHVTIKNQINSISNDSLHDLELAKLQFISHKLAKTMHLLKASLVQEVLEGEAAEARVSASGATN